MGTNGYLFFLFREVRCNKLKKFRLRENSKQVRGIVEIRQDSCRVYDRDEFSAGLQIGLLCLRGQPTTIGEAVTNPLAAITMVKPQGEG